MPGVYLDTSALGRLVLDEPDSDAIAAALSNFEAIVSSRLLSIELHRLGLRADVPAEEIDGWLSAVALVPIDQGVISTAESIPPASVAALDAIHLATALDLAAGRHIDALMTFDERLAEGAHRHELPVVAPS